MGPEYGPSKTYRSVSLDGETSIEDVLALIREHDASSG